MSVYFIRHQGHIKIGKSVDPWKRLASLQTAHYEPLEMLAIMPGSEDLEQGLHRAFGKYMKRGEWFQENDQLLAFIEMVKVTFSDIQRQFEADPVDLPIEMTDDCPVAQVITNQNGVYKSHFDKSPLEIGQSFTFRMTHKGHFRNPATNPNRMWSSVNPWAYGYWEEWQLEGWKMLCAAGIRFDFVDAQHISIMRYADGSAPGKLAWGGTLRYCLRGVLNDALKEAVYNRKNNETFLAVYNDEEYGATVAVNFSPGTSPAPLHVPEEVIDYWRQYQYKSPLPKGVSIEA